MMNTIQDNLDMFHYYSNMVENLYINMILVPTQCNNYNHHVFYNNEICKYLKVPNKYTID